MTRREKLLYLLRLVPMVEANCNMHRTGPQGDRQDLPLPQPVSYYAHVLSGGKATPAGLFINNATGKVGVVGSRDAVVFDEIANTDFTDPKALVSIMQGYMQDAKFSRGKKEILAFASIVMVGNLDVQGKLPHEKYYHLFEPLPDFLQVEAFIDRLHGYLPGWEIPKIHPGLPGAGLRLHHRLLLRDHARAAAEGRAGAVEEPLPAGGHFVGTGTGITGRDVRGVEKTLSGLLKLMYPHGEVNDEQLGELLSLAIEGRQRVRNQLHLMAAGEYGPVVLAAKLTQSGKMVTPTLPDADREQKVALPSEPTRRRGHRPGGDRRRPGLPPALRDAGDRRARPDRQPRFHAESDEGERCRRRSVHQDPRQDAGPARTIGRRTSTSPCWRR